MSAWFRAQEFLADHLNACVMTGGVDLGTVAHSVYMQVEITTPTDGPIALTKVTCVIIAKLFQLDGIRYARAGDLPTDLRQIKGVPPLDIF